jgi:hypothetical protein
MTWKGRSLADSLTELRVVHGTNANDEAIEAEARLTDVEARDAKNAARDRQRREDLARTYPSLRR